MSIFGTFIERHPVLTYFALTFAISWGGVLMVVAPGGITATPEEVQIEFPFVVATMLAGPVVAGILMTGFVSGKAGLREVGSRLLRWRVGACWYLICVAAAAWLTFFATSQENRTGNQGRQAVLLAFAILYIFRAGITLFIFMKRRIPWWEAASGGGLIGFMLFLFLRDGLRTPQPLAFLDAVGAAFYFAGSYIGTASEYSRHLWKIHPENKGHLYTEGLFRYCRHINYFADLLLFCGFAVLTRQLWTGIVPLAMGLNFVLFLIPAHDAYLSTRYGAEFEDYARRTKKLVPLVY